VFGTPPLLSCNVNFDIKQGERNKAGFDPPISVFRPHQSICHGEVTVRGPSHLSVPTRRTARHFSADDQSDLTVGCSSLGSAFQVLQRACASELLVWNLGASAPLPQSSTKETTAGEEIVVSGSKRAFSPCGVLEWDSVKSLRSAEILVLKLGSPVAWQVARSHLSRLELWLMPRPLTL
jgi:hypothetical protein